MTRTAPLHRNTEEVTITGRLDLAGTVSSGTDVVDSIMSVAGSSGGIQPIADIRIGAVTVTTVG